MATIKDKTVNKELGEKRYPSVEVAELRIKQALLKYKVIIEKTKPIKEEKVRL